MPLLGIFSKKNKPQRTNSNGDGTTSPGYAGSELESTLSSPTSEYVKADKTLPSSPNGRERLHPNDTAASSVYPFASASSSKLRLPFRRKNKPSAATSSTSVATTSTDGRNFNTPPRPSYLSRASMGAVSEADASDLRLGPPPSKSAIFGAYGDSNGALSTRSLPADPPYPRTDPPSLPPTGPKNKKSTSFFPWSKSPASAKHTSKENGKEKAREIPPPLPSSSPSDPSFNLKSFRHVRPPSPNHSPTSYSGNVQLPPPRPRNPSVGSDASQRISVAAFREAQARRSTAGSPVSFRSPSPHGIPPTQKNYGNISNPRLMPSSDPRAPSQNKNPLRNGNRTGPVGYTSESDESSPESSEEEEEVDSDEVDPKQSKGAVTAAGLGRRRTITQRSKSADVHVPSSGKRARSELGHGSPSPSSSRAFYIGNKSPDIELPPKVQTSHSSMKGPLILDGAPPSPEKSPVPVSPPRSQSSLGLYGAGSGTSRQRASASTSALLPSDEAKKASKIAVGGSPASKRASYDVRGYSNSAATPNTNRTMSSDSSDDSDDDNAPLATLVAPRRPGSAMSHNSNNSNPNLRGPNASRTNLSLSTNGSKPKPLIDITQLTGTANRAIPGKEGGKGEEGFTKGATLLSTRSGSSGTPSATVSPVLSPMSQVMSKSPPTKFVSPPASPVLRHAQLGAMAGPSGQGEENMSSPVSEVGKRRIPVRKGTAEQPVTGVVAMEGGSNASGSASATGKRDVLNERLTRVVQVQIGAGAKSPSSPSVGDGGVVEAKEKEYADVDVDTKRAQRGHRRSSSDTTSSPADAPLGEDLRTLLGAGIRFVSRDGSEDDDDQEGVKDNDDEDSDEDSDETGPEKQQDRIAPIPIKQRALPPAFAVMSRPQNGAAGMRISVADGPPAVRQRSSTLVPSSTTASSFGASTSTSMSPVDNKSPFPSPNGNNSNNTSGNVAASPTSNSSAMNVHPAKPGPRQRSTTMLPHLPIPSSQNIAMFPPSRPFAASRERASPASSTGDSSSGPAPLTPRDGSDLSTSNGGWKDGRRVKEKEREQWSGGVSGLALGGAKGRGHNRRSVSFDFDEDASVSGGGGGKGKGKGKETPVEEEERRRERRRSEARAAIELGNVINGRGPIEDVDEDEDEDDQPINTARMNMNMNMNMGMGMNPMMGLAPMGFAGSPGQGGWAQQPMLSPAQFMLPQPADHTFFAAHQQAMMIAKQAYQMAVAQQAMAAAGEEWERGSSVGGFSGGASRASVYGGGPSPPIMNSPQPMPYGMMGMQNTGGWSTGSVMFPASPRSMYGGVGSAQSEYGGGGGRGGSGWNSSRSVYGESFGPSPDRFSKSSERPGFNSRESGYFPPVPPIPQQGRNGNSASRPTPRSRTASQPASPSRGTQGRKAPPPSSWKAGM